MINIRSIDLSNEGQVERIAATYDKINDAGEIVAMNKRISRVITDEAIKAKHADLLAYVQKLIEEE